MIRRHGNPALLGLFVLGALALLFVTLFTVAGGKLLTRKQTVVMHFAGSIYGLQIGAPVVFRGVRLGSVSSIGVAWDKGNNSVSIPVQAELESDMIRNVSGANSSDDPRLSVPALVERGLRAQLAMQSLLTGQLYVDLDFRRDKPSRRLGGSAADIEIPTVATGFQELKSQVDQLDLKRLMDDISAIASTTRAVISAPELNRAVKDLDDIAKHMASLTGQLDRRAGPLIDATTSTLAATRSAAERVNTAASATTEAAKRVGTTFNPEGPLVNRLRGASEELGRTAVTLREAVGNDAPLNQELQRALSDLAQAARALRELADTLSQEPESLVRGRRAPPDSTAIRQQP